MLLKPIWITAFLLIPSAFVSQDNVGRERIQWLSIEQANLKMKEDPRPVIIDLYAKWCYWCKVMDKKTYNNQKVVEYINQKFYPVKLDAETKERIQWRNREFDYNKDVNMNEFSLFLTNGQLSFPTTVIYTSANEAPATVPGFMSPDEIEPILKYFGEKHYKTQTFQDFLKGFKKSW